MTDRITRETVTFSYPFELADVEGKQPAGTYTIETIEEPIDSVSFVAYRRDGADLQSLVADVVAPGTRGWIARHLVRGHLTGGRLRVVHGSAPSSSTTIVLASQKYGGASRQVVTIDPSDLEAARKRDAEHG